MKTTHLILFVFISAGLFFSCKDNTTNVEQPAQNVFVAKFTNNWLSAGNRGYIIISDMEGNVLADSSWQGNVVLNLKQKDGSDFPDKIMVTTISVDSGLNRVRLTTNMAVTADAWVWKGYPLLEYNGEINFNYQNIPQHSDYRISVHYMSVSGRDIASRTRIDVPFDINDIYIYLNTLSGGPGYLWLTNKNAGDTVTVDFTNLKQLTEQTIIFPGWGKGYRGFIYGYPSATDHYTRSYTLQNSGVSDSVATSFSAYYPKGLFASYRASLYVYDDYHQMGWKDYYRYLKYGSTLPTEFVKMNADFTIINTSPLDFSIEPSGSFEEIESYWDYYLNGTLFSWNVYGPEDLTSYQLPLIPQHILSEISGLQRESFNLDQVLLMDQLGLNSYSEIIATYFKSDQYFYNIASGALIRSKGNPQETGNTFSLPEAAVLQNNGLQLEK